MISFAEQCISLNPPFRTFLLLLNAHHKHEEYFPKCKPGAQEDVTANQLQLTNKQ